MKRTRTGLSAATALLAVLGMLLIAGSASAANPVLTSTFTCSAGTPCVGKTLADGTTPDTESLSAERLAVDDATGDVYVIDTADDAIDHFSASGAFLGQLRVPAGEGGSFGFAAESDVAVDNSSGANAGTVYVTHGEHSGPIFAFNPNGTFKWKADGFEEPCGIGVTTSGSLYVMNWGSGLQQLDPADGSAIGSPLALQGGHQCQFAFDSTGMILAVTYGGGVDKYDPSGTLITEFLPHAALIDVAVDTSSDNVYTVKTNGITKWTDAGVAEPSSFAANLTGVTVNSADSTVYAAEGSQVSIFAPAASLTVNIGGGGIGQVKCDGGVCASGYLSGSEIELEAEAGSGYAFAGWIGCKSTGPNTCSLTLTEDTELTAVFLAQSKATPEPPGLNCPNGGVKIESAGNEEYVCSGSNGANGADGSNGADGAAGANGKDGSNGANGKDGAAGPAGPQGKQGPAGKVTCKVKQKGKKVKVTCKVKQGASASRVHWRLSRAGHTVRHGSARHGRVKLGALPSGHYRLHLAGSGGSTAIVVS